MKHPLFLIRGIDWTTRSAGINLLHTLAERLFEKGEFVSMSPCRMKPGSKIEKFNEKMIDGRPVIVIEPEVFGGTNPWADLTVRWLLNNPGKAASDQTATWGKDDLIFHLDPLFSFKDSMLLTFGMVNHSIFNNRNNHQRRVIDCFYGRKSLAYGKTAKCPEGVIDISNAQYSQRGLADLFRETKTFYTSELTSCSIEALLCGAKQQFIPSDYLAKDPVKDYLAWHQGFEDNSDSSLTNFISVCHDRVAAYA